MTTSAPAIEQALADIVGSAFRIVTASPGFLDDWTGETERLCRGIGTPPAGLSVELALFAQPLGKAHVVIVQFRGDATRLAFRLLVLDRASYCVCGADPFLIADRFPPEWTAPRGLPTLTSPAATPPPRTVEQLQHVLQTGGSQTLLGAVQALIDGSRLVVERAAPAEQFVRDLWQLLPYAAQAELWPATMAFADSLDFHVLVVPTGVQWQRQRYWTEEQALDYPHGRYELALQYAIEHADQRAVERLLARRSSKQTLRLAVFILIGAIVLALVMGLLQPK